MLAPALEPGIEYSRLLFERGVLMGHPVFQQLAVDVQVAHGTGCPADLLQLAQPSLGGLLQGGGCLFAQHGFKRRLQPA